MVLMEISKNRRLLDCIFVFTFTFGCHQSFLTAQKEWWPSELLLDAPAELFEIPSLQDETFKEQVAEVQNEISRGVKTNRQNFEERSDLARLYYSALQSVGLEIPRIRLLATNLTQARNAEPDELFFSFTQAVDGIFVVGGLLEQYRDGLGEFVLIEPADTAFEARRYMTLRFEYRVGKVPIKKGSKFRFAAHWYNDMSPLQFRRPLYPGYTTVHTEKPGVKLVTGMEPWNAVWGSLYTPGLARPVVTVAEGELIEGDTIEFILGDRSEGGPGLLMHSTAIDVLPIRFELNPTGDGLTYMTIGEPKLAVHGSLPHHLRVVGPSTVSADEPFTVKVAVEDAYFNRAIDGPPELYLWRGQEKIAQAKSMPGNPSIFHFKGLMFPPDRTEPLYLVARDREGKLWGKSNPIVEIDEGDPHVYWGELHGHEAYTDGSGTAEWYMRYARDVGFLDFASLSSHDLMISELHLRDVARASQKYHEPGRFVSLKGYEWTQDPRFGGHHNVYYRDFESRVIPVYEARTIKDLYQRQAEVNGKGNVLIVPHCHLPGDWNFNSAAMERLVEIYSSHGSFEWFGRRYLEQGYHIGLIAGGDDHTGHPGNNPALSNNRTGHTAVFADELTRDAMFDGLLARRVYGTSFARIYLETEVEGAPMGSEVGPLNSANRAIKVEGRVAGTAPIARIVAVCNGKESHVVDYANVPTSSLDSNLLRVLIGSSSEPEDTEQVLPPLAPRSWMGRLQIAKGSIESVIPISLEGIGETFVQTGMNRVDFSCRTRGDQDGVLIEMEEWPRQGSLALEIYDSPATDRDGRGLLTIQNPVWGEDRLRPDRNLVERVSIPLSELDDGAVRREFRGGGWILVERVANDLPPYREFSFQVTKNVDPVGENYVYVRVEQIDDEKAWSSPVWLSGKEPPYSWIALASLSVFAAVCLVYIGGMKLTAKAQRR